MIAWGEELPSQPAGHAAVTVALADGEAEVYFAPAHGFTIWADGVVDRTIRARGVIGYGVIAGPEPAPVTSDDGGRRDGKGPPGGPRR